MIKPTPYTCHCPSCGWEKTVSPQSDSLEISGEMAEALGIPADYYNYCPKCGKKELKKLKINLQTQQATKSSTVFMKIFHNLKK